MMRVKNTHITKANSVTYSGLEWLVQVIVGVIGNTVPVIPWKQMQITRSGRWIKPCPTTESRLGLHPTPKLFTGSENSSKCVSHPSMSGKIFFVLSYVC